MDIKRILFPTALSSDTEAAGGFALDLAKRYGAKLFVLHVIYDIEKDLNWYNAQIRTDDLYKEMEEAAGREFGRMAGGVFKGFGEVEYVLLKGIPYEEILRFSEEKGIDLIVMGTHSRKGLDRMLFGSTASKVVRSASCAVLTVRIPNEAIG